MYKKDQVLMMMLLCGLSTAVGAAQPYVTDDAAILDKGDCQFEIGRKVNRGSQEVWLLPACNLTGNVELTLGKTLLTAADSTLNQYVVQAKGLFTADRDAPQAWGWVAGLSGHPRNMEDRRQLSSLYGSLLYTREIYSDRLFVHANLGARTDREERSNETTWGVAAEINITNRLTIIAETFGDDRTRPLHQAGLRVALIPERLELDISHGAENGPRSGTRWWTLGLRIIQQGLF